MERNETQSKETLLKAAEKRITNFAKQLSQKLQSSEDLQEAKNLY